MQYIYWRSSINYARGVCPHYYYKIRAKKHFANFSTQWISCKRLISGIAPIKLTSYLQKRSSKHGDAEKKGQEQQQQQHRSAYNESAMSEAYLRSQQGASVAAEAASRKSEVMAAVTGTVPDRWFGRIGRTLPSIYTPQLKGTPKRAIKPLTWSV